MPIAATADLLLGGLNITLPVIIIIITWLGCVIFMAISLRLGLMMLFFLNVVEALGFWAYGVSALHMNLITMTTLASFVLLSLSIMLSKSRQGGYGGVA